MQFIQLVITLLERIKIIKQTCYSICQKHFQNTKFSECAVIWMFDIEHIYLCGNVLNNFWSTLYPIQSFSATLHYLITYKIDRLIIHSFMDFVVVFQVELYPMLNVIFFLYILLCSSTILIHTLGPRLFFFFFCKPIEQQQNQKKREKIIRFYFNFLVWTFLFARQLSFHFLVFFNHFFFSPSWKEWTRNDFDQWMYFMYLVYWFCFLLASAHHH